MSDDELKALWKNTRRRFDSLESELVECYVSFLREAAKYYLQQGRRVFFRENRVVHWGEGSFGSLVIEGREEPENVFGSDVPEIRFEPKIDRKITDAHIEIKERSLKKIRY